MTHEGRLWYVQFEQDAKANPHTVPSNERIDRWYAIYARVGEPDDPWQILWEVDDKTQTIYIDYFGPAPANRRRR